MDGVLLPSLELEEVVVRTRPARHWMDGIVERVKASDEPDFIQGALAERLVLSPCLLLDETRRDKADRNIMFGGVHHYAIALELVTFRLEEVLTFSAKLGSPYLVWRGPVFILEGKSGVVGMIRILKTSSHIVVKGRDVLFVKDIQPAELFRGENFFVDLHLGENGVCSRSWSCIEGKKADRA